MSDSVVGPEAGYEDTGPVTIYDIQAAEESRPLELWPYC
jgi:hypothetical protein